MPSKERWPCSKGESNVGNQNRRYQVCAQAAGHTDGRVTRQTLPEALEWLWQGYPMK